MIRRPPRSTRTDTLFPYTTLFRSALCARTLYLGGHLPAPSSVSIKNVDAVNNLVEFLVRFRLLVRVVRNKVGILRGHRCSRSEEHTSELQSLMRISYAVFCLKKKNNKSQIK